MRNRWFHPVRLHTPDHEHEKKVTWLELFYDLIFVAAFIQLGDGLSSNVDLKGFAQFCGVFMCLWIAWTGFTLFVNRFIIDDFIHRILVFVQMFSVGGMAVTAGGVLEGSPYYFAGAYAVAQLMVAIFYLRAWRHVKDARDHCRYWGFVFLFGAFCWTVSLLLPTPLCYAMWPLGVIGILISPFSRASRALQLRFPADQEHLSERYGLLTLIVLGESFVKVLSTLNTEGAHADALVQMSTTLLITCAIWWIYFDDVAGSKIKRTRLTNLIWLYAHLPLQIAVTASGVAIKKAVHFDLVSGEPAADKYRWLLSGTLALVMLSVALIDSVTERRNAELSDRARVNVRVFSGMLILVLAPAGGGMSALMYMVLVTMVCLAQVVFDMMMAPFEDSPEMEVTTTAELHRRKLAGESREGARPRRQDIGQVLRKGAPSALRRDFYFFLMEGSWKRFFVVLIFLYVVTNVFFAALFTLQPGSISGSHDSFAEAFYFSVQTLSTIGYGAMSPETEYGNILVTIEAAVGMLGVALATGLMFAKASQPRSSALFSRVMTLSPRNGVPTLLLRVGNARGNDVVDATIDITVLIDELTPEGEHMRRLHELELVRRRTPLFAVSWTVMHEITESSPLYGLDWDSEDSDIIGLIVTLMGHDGTYGQTVYARKIYYVEDVRHDHRFVDVINQLEDGRLMIDYERFHDTVPVVDDA